MALRKSNKVASGITLENAQEIMHNLAVTNAKERELIARQDQEISKVREKYAQKLAGLKALDGDYRAQLQSFAEANRDEFFVVKKSLDWNTGTIGFRTGTPALKARKGYQWAGVLELVKEKLPNYVRVKEEVMKDKLLADRDQLTTEQLSSVGVEVVQDESFFIEIKTDAVTA